MPPTKYLLPIFSSQLHTLRPPLPDVPAIYFVSPTLENIRRIAQDLQKSLYESFYLNFVEPLPRSLLEELAASVVQDGTGEAVEQVRSRDFYLLTSLDAYLTSGHRPIFILYIPFPFSLLSFVPTASTAIDRHPYSFRPCLDLCYSQFSLLN